MGSELLPVVAEEGFSIRVERSDAVVLVVSGNADMEMSPVLGPYLDALHLKLRGLRLQRVEVDFRELYFMNSSCFKAFLVWISNIGKLEPAARYTVRFISNPNFTWQARNLEAMQDFAPNLVEISVA